MHHFFVSPTQVKKEEITITGGDVHHIRSVLRMKEGDPISVSDGEGRTYLCQIQVISQDEVLCQILEEKEMERELPSKLFLFQAVPKGDKMDGIVQKAVELGVYQIIPTMNARTVARMDEDRMRKKVDRWNHIAESAAKQSEREILPKVEEITPFSEALDMASGLDVKLIPYEEEKDMTAAREIFSRIRPGDSVGIFIGPEGGFEPEEIREAEEHGLIPISLGRRILRTETAGIMVLSNLMFHLECEGE